MAKCEWHLQGNFDEILGRIEQGILEKSVSASFEEGSDYQQNGVRCAVRVYERYSMMGGNRVSMNVTLCGRDEELFLSGITSGGSQGVFFKFNTIGEETFLDCLSEIVKQFEKNNER